MEENKWIQLLQKHWFKGVLGLLSLAMILVWSERLFGKKHVGSRQDYLVVNQIHERYQRGEPIELESLLSAEGIVKRYPELRPSYETMLAQLFFTQSDFSKGVSYATCALERNAEELPSPYVDFGRASLMIADGKLDEALIAAQTLQAEEGSYLEVFNLLRLCMLEEQPSWEKLRAHPRFESLSALFQEGAVSLEDFLSHPIPRVADHSL